jgi:hypothetical protein
MLFVHELPIVENYYNCDIHLCCCMLLAIAKRKCRVDFATCPENSTVGEFDYCEDTPEAAAAAAAATEERGVTTTFHNCNCKAGWIYTYADGTKANFSACANPDGDPMVRRTKRCDGSLIWALTCCNDTYSCFSTSGSRVSRFPHRQ